MDIKSYIIDQLILQNPIFLAVLVVFALLSVDFLFVSCFWTLYLTHQLFKQGKYYKSTMKLVKGFEFVNEEEFRSNARKAEYHKTMWYKTLFLLMVCVCEIVSGLYIIVSLVMGSYTMPIPAVNGTNNSINCSITSSEVRMNYMVAIDSPSFLVPIGLVNGLLIYLNISYSFYGKSYRKLVYKALSVSLKVSIISILALIPSNYTIVASQGLLFVFLFHETLCYFLLSRKLVKLLRARNLDLRYESASMDRYKKAEQSVNSFVYYTRINQLCGVLIQLSVLFIGTNRIIQLILGDPCLSSPATIRSTYEVTEILYYPSVLFLLASSFVFLIPYTLVTIKYTYILCKKRYEPVYKPLMRPLIE